ncbi:hypothetical protein [uncultured Caulobacter sp.]|uniref:hypothetical protein n=1 Tax=uncultured Caulobacter sp. TaxID=158749 RepID=UPI0026349271|nr:hypothetical protein [uncultured Caulobacter sp.]
MRKDTLLAASAVVLLLQATSAGAQAVKATEAMPAELAHWPSPRPTADQVLSGNIPGRPTSDPAWVKPEVEASGFDPAALYSTPPVGQHPRVLFSAKDLPRIRAQIQASQRGKRLWGEWKTLAAAPEREPTTWLSQAYAALASGDVAAFQKVWDDPRNPRQSGPPGGTTNQIQRLLFMRSVVAQFDGDAKLGRETATASSTYIAWLRPQVERAISGEKTQNYWNAVRPVMGDSATVAMLYDLNQPFMTTGQADAARGLLALAMKDHYGLGMDLPPHWRNWNFIGMGLMYPLMALSIEGEPGYDPRIVARGQEVARDYTLYSVSKNGVGREGMGYQTAGWQHAAILDLALANRGKNLFTLSRWRRLFDTWAPWAMQPTGGYWSSQGDLGTFPPIAGLVSIARSLYPKDSVIEQVARQTPEESRIEGFTEDMLLALLYPNDLGQDRAAGKAPSFPSSLGLSLFDEERGHLFTRTGWDPNALSLQLTARTDTINASHDHAARGDFYLTALGQVWSMPSMRETESKYHSVVMVDGLGQGYFPTPAKWVDRQESAAGSTATLDLSYAYSWRWMKSSFLATDKQLADEPWLEVFREARDRLLARAPRDKWERDPSPSVRAYYAPNTAGDPRMWGDEDAWVVRTPYNPVRRAFRSVAMVRGASPFVMIADDIQKDDRERLYEWRMAVPNDVEIHSIKGGDVILGPVSDKRDRTRRGDGGYKDVGAPTAAKGTPMLLVRVIDMAKPAVPEESPNINLQTLEYLKTDDTHQFAGRSFGVGKMLVIPNRGAAPGYRVLLYPFRQGEPLPKTTWDGHALVVERAGKTARVEAESASDGSTRLRIARAD